MTKVRSLLTYFWRDAAHWGIPITLGLIAWGVIERRLLLSEIMTLRFIATGLALLLLGSVVSFVVGVALRKLRLDPEDNDNS